MCRKHRDTPVEFYSEVQNTFFCRRCAKDFAGHDVKCISDIASDVQNSLTGLKHLYLTKRTYLLDRLVD
jgi:hypothetical protein